jgi:hypothetical protein
MKNFYDIQEALIDKIIVRASVYSKYVTLTFSDGSYLEIEASIGESDEPNYYGSDPFGELIVEYKDKY